MPDTPKHSGTIFADITAPISGNINALLHANVYLQCLAHTSSQSSNNAGTQISAYTLVNFRFGLEDKEAGWSLTANLRNAFNRTYYVGGLPVGTIYQINLLVPGDPRTFAVEARLKF